MFFFKTSFHEAQASPQTHYVAEGDAELPILLLQPLKFWSYECAPLYLVYAGNKTRAFLV